MDHAAGAYELVDLAIARAVCGEEVEPASEAEVLAELVATVFLEATDHDPVAALEMVNGLRAVALGRESG